MKPEAPYYESRYLRANHPERRQALWLRETLLLPTVGEPVADVWVMLFDNSALATCRMQVAGKAFERAELVATRRAMFEILTDTRHDAVPLLA